MRDMEELQKSNVLKVEELSRRKLTEDFEAVTSFFQGSNVKTFYHLGDNDAKYPDTETDDEHTTNSLASPLYLREREASASLLQVYHSQRESLFQRAQSILASTGQPVDWMSQKCKSNQEFDNCQIRIIFGNTREQLLAETKSEILRHEYRADLAENNSCELKRQIDSQAVEIGHTRTGYEQSDENKLHITKNWQIENEHFVIFLLEVFKSWKNWREIGNFDSRNFREEEWSKIILKKSNLYAVNNYFTFQFNQRYFLFLVN